MHAYPKIGTPPFYFAIKKLRGTLLYIFDKCIILYSIDIYY